MEAVSSMQTEGYALNSHHIREDLELFCRADCDSTDADFRLRSYYRTGGGLVWIDRAGVDDRADTLLGRLRANVNKMGFNEQSFFVKQIESDVNRLRTLSFDDANGIDRVAARLEYHLSKAYLRYAMGMRFGFTNPVKLLNNLDVRDVDTLGNPLSYRGLFDVDMESPGKYYAQLALRKVGNDSLADYLDEINPHDEFYDQMLSMLPGAADARRRLLLVNMERRRWRERSRPKNGQKYIVVNVPAYHLWAVNCDSVIDMRAACGALKTKTPLLSSSIYRMDVNPEWNIPMSIIRDDISRHAGDSGYFARRRYYITDRKTGKRLPIRSVSQGMLLSGRYRVAQAGGPGNSLGRIIFRFANNFDVFLHDTSSPGVFNRDNRGVSHGCVRVQRPFDLARFLTEKTEEEQPDSLMRSQGVTRVPLYITYYTYFQTPNDGQYQTYPDVYGYDRVIYQALSPYLK